MNPDAFILMQTSLKSVTVQNKKWVSIDFGDPGTEQVTAFAWPHDT